MRDYRPADFPRVCEIDRACFEAKVAYSAAEMSSALRARGSLALVAENSKGDVVGFLVTHGGHIITLDVLPRYRQRGIGRKLLVCCEKRLCAAGVRAIHLETADRNRAAQALYVSLGYTFVKRLPRYYATGEDGWLMKKALDVRPKAAARTG